MEIMYPKGYHLCHAFDIYTDLIAVFEDNIVYTIEDIIETFSIKDYSNTSLARGTHTYAELAGKVYKNYVFAGDKKVRYADYLYPLFYIAVATQKSNRMRPMRDVAGRIYAEYNISKPRFKNPLENIDDMRQREDWKKWQTFWFKPYKGIALHYTLTESEHAESDELYNIYLRAKMVITLPVICEIENQSKCPDEV